MDNRSPAYAGDLGVGMNPKLGQRLREADCLLVLGARLTDIATGGFELIDPAAPGKTILHVHPDAGPSAASSAPILASPPTRAGRCWTRLGGEPPWATRSRAICRLRRAPSTRRGRRPAETPGAVKHGRGRAWLPTTLPDDAIITNGAGNYAAWVHRYFRFKRFGTQLAPTSGSMGYGFPAAVAASSQHPDRPVVCFAGDGCFQMTLNEMSTAMQHGAKPIVIVANNGRYGTIRMHQEKHYPGRVSGRTSRCGNGMSTPFSRKASQSARYTLPRMLVSPPVGSSIQNRRM
jgi:acetolactate synthase-1/2/3 large subunit